MRPLTCRCGQEVRWGTRNGRTTYLHQFEVDHDFSTAIVELQSEEEEKEAEHIIEPIEVYATPVPIDGSRVFAGGADGTLSVLQLPGGAKSLVKLATKHGWLCDRATYARGPYMHATKDASLGVSETVLVRLRLDPKLMIIASWRDNKFDWSWIVRDRTTTRSNSNELKELIKTCRSSPMSL